VNRSINTYLLFLRYIKTPLRHELRVHVVNSCDTYSTYIPVDHHYYHHQMMIYFYSVEGQSNHLQYRCIRKISIVGGLTYVRCSSSSSLSLSSPSSPSSSSSSSSSSLSSSSSKSYLGMQLCLALHCLELDLSSLHIISTIFTEDID